MRKVALLLALSIFIFAGSVYAAPITLRNVLTFNSSGVVSSGDGTGTLMGYGRGSVNLLNGAGDYVRWTQAFTFNPPPESSSITGRISITLRDDSNSWLDGPEFAIGWTNTGTWAIGEVDTGKYNYNVTLVNGSLTVTLASLGGDFYIDSATLQVSYNPASAPVPEPASLILLGLGMLSAGVITKRRNRKK